MKTKFSKIVISNMIGLSLFGSGLAFSPILQVGAEEMKTSTISTEYINGETFVTPYYKITPSYPRDAKTNTEITIYYNVEFLKKTDLYAVQILTNVTNGTLISANPNPTNFTENRVNFLDTDRTKQYKVLIKTGATGKLDITGKFSAVGDDMKEPEMNYNFSIKIGDEIPEETKKAKEAAKAEIKGLPNLTEEEKAAFSKQVDEGKDIPTVDKIVEAAKAKDNENGLPALTKAKEAAKAEIKGLPNLTEEEKATFSKQVDEAKDIPTVDKIVEAAKAKDNENGLPALAKAKEAAKAEIKGLPNLTEEEKAAFNKQVDEAKDIPTVNKIVEAAKAKDNENGLPALAKAKEAAKAEIKGLPNLTEEEKAAFSKQVDEAKDIPTVNKIVEAASTNLKGDASSGDTEQVTIPSNSVSTNNDQNEFLIDNGNVLDEVESSLSGYKSKDSLPSTGEKSNNNYRVVGVFSMIIVLFSYIYKKILKGLSK